MRYLWPSLLSLACLILLSPDVDVHAQKTDATCVAEFSWTSNALGQNPCLVTAYLITGCMPSGAYVIWTKLPKPHTFYAYPSNTSDPTADCACSTVTYSLMQACQVCQFNASDGPVVRGWPQFSETCQRKTVRNYPRPLLPGTAVPAWALLDVAQSGSFDIATAQRVAKEGDPDATSFPLPPSASISTTSSPIRTSSTVSTSPQSSSAHLTPSTTSSPSTPAASTSSVASVFILSSVDISPTSSISFYTSIGSVTFTLSDSATSTSSRSTDNTAPALSQRTTGWSSSTKLGEIIGAVIGGVSIAALLCYLLLRRRRRINTTLAGRRNRGNEKANTASEELPIRPLRADAKLMLLYNPDDPSTFPTAETPTGGPPGASKFHEGLDISRTRKCAGSGRACPEDPREYGSNDERDGVVACAARAYRGAPEI